MLAFLLTAALLADPSPRTDVGTKSSLKPVTETVRSEPGSMLAGVAVTLECTARADGRVTTCRVMSETHPGLGFGEAAVALMTGTETPPSPEARAFSRTIQFTP